LPPRRCSRTDTARAVRPPRRLDWSGRPSLPVLVTTGELTVEQAVAQLDSAGLLTTNTSEGRPPVSAGAPRRLHGRSGWCWVECGIEPGVDSSPRALSLWQRRPRRIPTLAAGPSVPHLTAHRSRCANTGPATRSRSGATPRPGSRSPHDPRPLRQSGLDRRGPQPAFEPLTIPIPQSQPCCTHTAVSRTASPNHLRRAALVCRARNCRPILLSFRDVPY
jgi:hypothetical protein